MTARHDGGLAAYEEHDILGMSPARRVVLLYSLLLANLRQAGRALAAEEMIERRGRCLLKAQEIVQELLFALDRKAGGELGDRLAAIYAYFGGELLAIERRPDAARLERLVAQVKPLYESWEAAARIAPGASAGAGGIGVA
jgi:flagellar protein FliS